MPIPNFNHNNVLPPHTGSPIQSTDLSPYACTILEVCHKFCTSRERILILQKFVLFRQKMQTNGILIGFQWLDGSFMEDIERTEGRPPNDLDVVTFYGGIAPVTRAAVSSTFPEFESPMLSKRNFSLDHYAVDYTFNPNVTVEMTRYWIQLFSHNRIGVWKGMLKLPLNTPLDDQLALDFLNSL